MTFAAADLPLQGVLVESATDIDQQSGGAGVDGTAEHRVVHALGHVDAEPQDHTHQHTFGREEERGSEVKQLD